MMFKVLPAVLLMAMISGCIVVKDPAAKVKAPPVPNREIRPTPKWPDDTMKIFVCDKAEPNVAEVVSQTAFTIRGTTDLQDLEMTHCDGKKTLWPKMDLRNFRQDFIIEAPLALKQPVDHVTVTNSRTCASRSVSVNQSVQPGTASWVNKPYATDSAGTITIGLSDSIIRIAPNGLPVMKGQNLIEVVYFDQKSVEIGRQTILVNVELESREINGVRAMNGCFSR